MDAPKLDLSNDVMLGAEAIATFLGMRPRQIYHAAEKGHLPLFKIGGLLCGRRSTLSSWMVQAERAALRPRTHDVKNEH